MAKQRNSSTEIILSDKGWNINRSFIPDYPEVDIVTVEQAQGFEQRFVSLSVMEATDDQYARPYGVIRTRQIRRQADYLYFSGNFREFVAENASIMFRNRNNSCAGI
jgi:hypothetical protein